MENRVDSNIEALLGLTLSNVNVDDGDAEIIFTTDCGKTFTMFHDQECCELVHIEDVCGDLKNIIGSPLLTSEERTKDDNSASESATWTFYELATIKGSVTIRWYGESNGYYSESVDIYELVDI